MIRLLLETATEVCSVAVARDQDILAEHTALDAHQHSSHLTLFIQQVVREAGIKLTEVEEIVLSDGPGSYTSLRVGAATAKGLCLALPGVKLRVVPTLLTVATLSRSLKPTLATINSRRGEVYGQLFGAGPQVQRMDKIAMEGNLWTAPQNIRLTEPEWYDKVLSQGQYHTFLLSGPGQQRVLDHLPPGVEIQALPPQHCSARLLLAPAAPPEPVEGFAPNMSRLVDVATYEPFYLNPPFVTKSKKKLLGR